MIQIGISDLSKNPAMLDKLHDIVQIVNKKTSDVKGVFVPNEYLGMFDKVFEEIEYKRFIERNRSLQSSSNEDDTLLDGLDDVY
jgi:hypothetical protein